MGSKYRNVFTSNELGSVQGRVIEQGNVRSDHHPMSSAFKDENFKGYTDWYVCDHGSLWDRESSRELFLVHTVPVKTARSPDNNPRSVQTLTERDTMPRGEAGGRAGMPGFTAPLWLGECEPCTMNDTEGVLVGSEH